jgi:gluconate 2-dehydrogenase gamma chain
MNRRESLKAIGLSTLSVGILLDACQPAAPAHPAAGPAPASDSAAAEVPGRQPFEVARDHKLQSETFFTQEEMATITVLVDLIIPKDAHSGSASDAGVPAYIEFTAKDEPRLQVPLRGGLRWLDLQCLERYGNAFTKCQPAQQIDLIDQIAYPKKADPSLQPGVAFFSRMRDLTASGFYTTQIGIDDLGYVGNHPGKWDGVPADVLKQYGMEDV